MIISVIAMVLAVPVAIGIALFITQYAPRRLAKPVAYVIDLLAAIPSIVYGIWGVTTLAPRSSRCSAPLAPARPAVHAWSTRTARSSTAAWCWRS